MKIGFIVKTAILAILILSAVSYAQNLPPVINPIGPQVVDEGVQLDVRIVATDPDIGDIITLTADQLPLNSIFNDSTGGVGGLVFTPDYTQSGVYQVRVFAADTAGLVDTALIDITVNNVDRAPVISPVAPQTVAEGGNLNVRVTAADPDGDPITLVAQQLPLNATFTDSTGGVGHLVFNPSFTQAGSYTVRIIANSTTLVDTELVNITVTGTDRPPVITPVAPQTVAEGGNLNVRVTAADPDGDPITLIAQQLPPNATFTDSTGGVGHLVFNPNYTQAGSYTVRIIANSTTLVDTELVSITVTNTDRAPVITPVAPQTVAEGGNLNVRVTAADPDGDPITLIAQQLPLNATFTDSTGGVGHLVFNPNYTQAGSYTVRIIANSTTLVDTELVSITVTNTDRAPAITPVAPQTVAEGGNLNVRVSAIDPDGDPITLIAQQLPPNATFTDSTGGVGRLVFNPDFTQAGSYTVRIIANSTTLVDTELVSITVTNTDRAPVITPVAPQTVAEGGNLNVRVTAADPDGDPITLIAQQLPLNATFTDSTGGVGRLVFNPSYTEAGSYTVRIIANSTTLVDTELVSITVTNTDRAPVITPVAPQTVAEGGNLNVRMTAADPDGDPITLIAQQLPLNATFTDSTGGVGHLVFNPNYTQAGSYTVRIIANSTTLVDTELVSITVTGTDRPPVITPVAPQTVAEGGNLNVRVTAADPDGDPITLIAQQLPPMRHLRIRPAELAGWYSIPTSLRPVHIQLE